MTGTDTQSLRELDTWDFPNVAVLFAQEAVSTEAATQSPGSFSTLPTNPRDWMVMDALPTELRHWQANALYILGDKAVLQDIPEDLYPNCMFVPIEVRARPRSNSCPTGQHLKV